MYEKICKVCGKPFRAANPNYCLCSDECRKIRQTEHNHNAHKKFVHTGRYKKYLHNYYKAHYKPTVHYCISCGDKLPDGRQRYCLKCLVKDYIENGSNAAYRRLQLRGYIKPDILEEAVALGLYE